MDKTWRGLSVGTALECVTNVSDRAWALVGLGQIEGGSCLIADVSAADGVQVRGLYCASCGDVLDCSNDMLAVLEDAELVSIGLLEKVAGEEPAVHILGSPEGSNGQITVRQPAGNYLRACRWDRIESNVPGRPQAALRTLPQCGCGGSLGSPQLFDSFVEMSAYHFCAFYASPMPDSCERGDDGPRDNR